MSVLLKNISLLEKNIITRDFELSPASIDLKATRELEVKKKPGKH